MRGQLQRTAPIIGAMLLMMAPNVPAEEAVHEINQAAVEEGLPPCDADPGFPCTLDEPGSYRLTSNLVATDPDTHILEITTDEVHLDLNGFALRGPAACTWSGSELSCTGSGDGDAVHAEVNGLFIHNGTVTGAGHSGVLTNDGAVLAELRIASCASHAISAGDHLRVRCSSVESSGGISSVDDARITDTVVRHCAGFGIQLAHNAVIARSIIASNDGRGIELGYAASVVSNVVRANADDGLEVRSGSLVMDNTFTSNLGYGLSVSSGSVGYGANVFGGNAAGTISGGAIELGTNLCEGDTTCP